MNMKKRGKSNKKRQGNGVYLADPDWRDVVRMMVSGTGVQGYSLLNTRSHRGQIPEHQEFANDKSGTIVKR